MRQEAPGQVAMANIEGYPYYPIPSIGNPGHRAESKKTAETGESFKQTFNNQLNEQPVKLSRHAMERLETRNIHLSASEWNQIHDKMREAKKMGVNDSLVLTKDAALVVNTPNNTVITAMDLQEAKSHVFTNIDGAILINH